MGVLGWAARPGPGTLQEKCPWVGLTRATSVPSDPVTYYTALHIAVLRNQPDMVELLVRHGADINRRDRVRAGSRPL